MWPKPKEKKGKLVRVDSRGYEKCCRRHMYEKQKIDGKGTRKVIEEFLSKFWEMHKKA